MGTKPIKITLLLSTLLTLNVAVQAAEQDNTPPTNDIDDIISITGHKTATPLNIAANVKIIDQAAIEMSGATTLTDVLRGQAGIQISDSNSGPVFSMRGFSADQAANNTLILVDGRRLNNTDIAAPKINAIALSQVDRIEILSGSAGVIYGDQAVGGVINIITKAPDSSGGSVQVSAGSFDTRGIQADGSFDFDNSWRLYTTANYNQGNNYRDHNDNKTGSILSRLQYQTKQQQFFIEGNYYNNRRQLAGSLTKQQFEQDPRQANSSYPNDKEKEITNAWRIGYRRQLNSQWQLADDINYSHTSADSVSYGSNGTTTRSLLEINPKAVADYDTRQGNLHLVIGANLHRGYADFNLPSTVRHNYQHLTSAYVSAEVPIIPTLNYVVGGRYSHVKDDLTDKKLYPNGQKLTNHAHALELGFNYRPTNRQRFYLRADDNFRFAKVDEQAYTAAGVKGLNPQTGHSYEAGWDLTLKKHTLRISGYRLDLKDEIVFVSSSGGGFGGANMNADSSRRYGLSTDWNWQVLSSTQWGVQANYIDAKFTQGANDGKQLPWVAKYSGRSYLSFDVTNNWQLFTEAVYTGSRYESGDNSNSKAKLDDYWLANIAVNYTQNNWLASLRVDNLFNRRYASAVYYGGFYSGTGRAILLTTRYSF